MNAKDFKKWRKKTLKRMNDFPALDFWKKFVSESFLKSCYYGGCTPTDCCNKLL